MKFNPEDSPIEGFVMKMLGCASMDNASEERQQEIIREMRKFHNLHAVDPSGKNLLSYAAAYGLNSITEFLIAKGLQMNVQDKQGGMPLIIALRNRHLDTAVILLKHGANPNLRDQWGNNALMASRCLSPHPVLRLLVKAGCDPNEKNNYGINAYKLYEAYPDVLQMLHDAENGVPSPMDEEAASKRTAFLHRISTWIREKSRHR